MTRPNDLALFPEFKHEILSTELLSRQCPLDYGRPKPPSRTDLGKFEVLAVEIQQRILEHVNVASLLAFRGVNRRASEVIDGMPTWRKVLDNASNVVRMAVGLKTAHRFTLSHLINRMGKKTCCRCRKPAPYFSVFTLTRHCTGIGPKCSNQIVQAGVLITGEMSNACTAFYEGYEGRAALPTPFDPHCTNNGAYASFSAIPGKYIFGETI